MADYVSLRLQELRVQVDNDVEAGRAAVEKGVRLLIATVGVCGGV
jgi:hypothetical protein